MNLIILPTTHNPYAHPTDHDFVHRIIAELEALPTKEKVVIPIHNRTSRFADIECVMGYTRDHRAYGEFSFSLKDQQLEMAHTAIVTVIVDDAQLKLQLQIKPNRKLRDAGHRSMTRILKTPKDMALAICRNYFPGSVGRKVIVMAKQKLTA